MASQKVPDKREYYTGPDAAFYEVEGGRLNPSPSFSNDCGFGTPPAPGLRGEAFGKGHSHGWTPPKANSVVGGFFRKGGK